MANRLRYQLALSVVCMATATFGGEPLVAILGYMIGADIIDTSTWMQP